MNAPKRFLAEDDEIQTAFALSCGDERERPACQRVAVGEARQAIKTQPKVA